MTQKKLFPSHEPPDPIELLKKHRQHFGKKCLRCGNKMKKYGDKWKCYKCGLILS